MKYGKKGKNTLLKSYLTYLGGPVRCQMSFLFLICWKSQEISGNLRKSQEISGNLRKSRGISANFGTSRV
jgi:hypothetical protein